MLQTPSHSPLYAFPKGGGGLGGMLHHPQRIHIALKVFLTGSSKGTGKRNPFTITFSFLLSFLLCHQWMSPFWALHRLSYLDPTKPWRQTSAFFKACGHQLPRPSDSSCHLAISSFLNHQGIELPASLLNKKIPGERWTSSLIPTWYPPL